MKLITASWRQWQPTPVLLPGKSHGRRSLEGCSPWGRYESDTTERLHFHFSLSCIGEGNGNPLQCSCLENPRDGEAWWAAVYGVAQSRTRLKWLSSSKSSVRLYGKNKNSNKSYHCEWNAVSLRIRIHTFLASFMSSLANFLLPFLTFSISFLKGIFPTQGLNPGLPHCRVKQTLYRLSHQGSPVFYAPKSLQMVTAAMKLKDTPWKESYDQPR